MRIYRNFKCQENDCGLVVELMIDNTVNVVDCECGGLATKMLSMPRAMSNTVGKNPSFSKNKA